MGNPQDLGTFSFDPDRCQGFAIGLHGMNDLQGSHPFLGDDDYGQGHREEGKGNRDQEAGE